MKPEEVRRRIQECKEQRLTELDLSTYWNAPDKEKLNAILDEVFDFVWLEILNLNYNQLSELPNSISRLQNLSILDLRQNYLRELPASIYNLQNLRVLNVSSWHTIPDQFKLQKIPTCK
jgi:Leucine-rich repeat (LRR) protein